MVGTQAPIQMFFTNIFSVSDRKAVCEHAYRSTRKQLWDRREELEPLFAQYGLKMRMDELADLERSLWSSVRYPGEDAVKPSAGPDVLDDLHSTLDRLEGLLGAKETG